MAIALSESAPACSHTLHTLPQIIAISLDSRPPAAASPLMPPKKGSKGKPSQQQQQHQGPKNLSSRVTAAASSGDTAAGSKAGGDGEQLQLLLDPHCMAFTELDAPLWALFAASGGRQVLINSYASRSPLWVDSFVLSVEPAWLEPPLHAHLTPGAQQEPGAQLGVQLWRERRLPERLALGRRMLEATEGAT